MILDLRQVTVFNDLLLFEFFLCMIRGLSVVPRHNMDLGGRLPVSVAHWNVPRTPPKAQQQRGRRMIKTYQNHLAKIIPKSKKTCVQTLLLTSHIGMIM